MPSAIFHFKFLFQDLDHTGIYLSQDKGHEWSKILDENYFFTSTKDTDLNSVIVAVKKNELTNVIIYSQDAGSSWNEYKFSKSLTFVNKLLIEPGEASSHVFLFCTKANKKSKVVFTFDFKLDESNSQKKYENNSDEQFEMTDLFDIETPNKIEKTSFNVDFFLDFPYDLHLNSFNVEIISYSKTSLSKEINFEVTYLKTSEPLDDREVETKYHKLIQTTETSIEVNNLVPDTEYHCYFYANLTSSKTNETRLLLLEKKLIVKTQKSRQLRLDISLNKLIIYFILLIGILFSLLTILVLKRKQIANRKKQVSNYKQMSNEDDEQVDKINVSIFLVDDQQFLIDKDDCIENHSLVS